MDPGSIEKILAVNLPLEDASDYPNERNPEAYYAGTAAKELGRTTTWREVMKQYVGGASFSIKTNDMVKFVNLIIELKIKATPEPSKADYLTKFINLVLETKVEAIVDTMQQEATPYFHESGALIRQIAYLNNQVLVLQHELHKYEDMHEKTADQSILISKNRAYEKKILFFENEFQRLRSMNLTWGDNSTLRAKIKELEDEMNKRLKALAAERKIYAKHNENLVASYEHIYQYQIAKESVLWHHISRLKGEFKVLGGDYDAFKSKMGDFQGVDPEEVAQWKKMMRDIFGVIIQADGTAISIVPPGFQNEKAKLAEVEGEVAEQLTSRKLNPNARPFVPFGTPSLIDAPQDMASSPTESERFWRGGSPMDTSISPTSSQESQSGESTKSVVTAIYSPLQTKGNEGVASNSIDPASDGHAAPVSSASASDNKAAFGATSNACGKDAVYESTNSAISEASTHGANKPTTPMANSFMPRISHPNIPVPNSLSPVDPVEDENLSDTAISTIVETLPDPYRYVCPASLIGKECSQIRCTLNKVCVRFNSEEEGVIRSMCHNRGCTRLHEKMTCLAEMAVGYCEMMDDHVKFEEAKEKRGIVDAIGASGEIYCKANRKGKGKATVELVEAAGKESVHVHKKVHRADCTEEDWRIRKCVFELMDAHAQGRYL